MSKRFTKNFVAILPGVLIFTAALIGVALANSPLQAVYQNLLAWPVHFTLGPLSIEKDLQLFINDFLMAVFFLYVALELKREFLAGELASSDQARLPVMAGLGGMLIPAAIYMIINYGGEGQRGWGIPMATDIAFALGILMALGSRVPPILKVLLTAVAVVDDLAAILVIAIFYTASVNMVMLAYGLVSLAILAAMNRIGVTKVSAYAAVGVILWFCFLKSGVHATIAGVLLAFTIPTTRSNTVCKKTIDDVYTGKRQLKDSPLVMFEKSLAPWVSFFILPIFALANSGVSLEGFELSSVGIGIILGLSLGKPLGIFAAGYLGLKTGILKSLPCTYRELIGLGAIAGVGFTMSLFIANLAFTSEADLVNESKGAILVASLISAVLGSILLLSSRNSKQQN